MADAFLNLVLYGVVWPPLLLIGIGGNIINIMVLQRRTLRSSTTVYLLILSISYLIQIIVRILRVAHGFPHLYENYEFRVMSGIYNVYIRYPIGNILVCFSNWLTVAMAFERCLVVGCVFKARHICTRRNAYVVSFTLLIASTIANLPRYFEYVPNYDRNNTGYAKSGPLGQNQTEAYTYFSIIFVTFLPFGTLVPISAIVIVLLTCHMRKLKALDIQDHSGRQCNVGLTSTSGRRHSKTKTRDNRMEANHRSVTILVIASNLLYLVCYGASVYTFFESARLGRRRALSNVSLRRMGTISDTLILANTSFSALLYCCCSSVYRREAYRLLRYGCARSWCLCQCCQPPSTRHTGTNRPPLSSMCHSNDRPYSSAQRKASTMLMPLSAMAVSTVSIDSNHLGAELKRP